MVRVPGAEAIPQISETTLRAPARSIAKRATPAAFGAGVAGAVAKVGAKTADIFVDIREKRFDTERRAALSDLAANLPIDFSRAGDTLINEAEPGAKGLTEKAQGVFNEAMESRLATIFENRDLRERDRELIRQSAAKLMTPHVFKMDRFEQAERKSSRADALNKNVQALAVEAARDPRGVSAALNTLDVLIKNAEPDLTPGEARKLKNAAARTIIISGLEGAIDKNPSAALAQLKGKDVKKLTDQGVTARDIRILKKRAEAEIKKRANAAKSQVVTSLRSLNDRFNNQGRVIPDAALADIRARAKATGDKRVIAATERVAKDNEFIVDFSAKPLLQQNQEFTKAIKGLSAAATADVANEAARKVGLMQKSIARTRQIGDTEPNAAAVRMGITIPNPVFFEGTREVNGKVVLPVESLRARRAAAPIAAERFGLRTPRFLDKVEADELTRRFNAADLKGKQELLNLIVEGFETDAPAVLAQIAPKDQTLAMAGMLVAADRSDVATDVLSGKAFLESNRANIPKGVIPDVQRLAFDKITPLFPAIGGVTTDTNGAATRRLVDAITSAYVASAVRDGRIADEGASASKVDDAVERVTGGIITPNDGPILAPVAGMSRREFLRLWSNVTPEILEKATGAKPVAVMAGKIQAVPAERLATSKLVSMGPGVYSIMGETPQGTTFLLGNADTKTAFIFKWEDVAPLLAVTAAPKSKIPTAPTAR